VSDVSNWDSGRQRTLAPPPRTEPTTAELAAPAAALSELERLRQKAARAGVDSELMDPRQAVYGLGPVEGPERAARQLEDVFGTVQYQPSWMNAEQFAEAAADYADDGPDPVFRAYDSQWLMSPERYTYMQEGPGRTVDLLKDLRTDPERAWRFYRKSEGARTTRGGYSDPFYARYEGVDKSLQDGVSSPLSSAGRYLGWQGVFPMRLKHGAAGATPGEAYGWANALDIASQRFRLGEVPVLDIDESVPGESAGDRAVRFADRYGRVESDVAALRGVSPEDLGRHVFGRPVPPAAGYLVDAFASALDGTAPPGLLASLATAPGKAMVRTATNAAARTAGTSTGAAAKMIDRAASVFPGESALQQGARVAEYRGVPASAYADALRRPTVAGMAVDAGKRLVREEGPPEAVVEGGLNAVLPQPKRTWGEFFGQWESPEAEEDFQKRTAEWRANAERAAIRMENLSNQDDQNGIWNEFHRAQEEARQKRLPPPREMYTREAF